MLGQKEIEELFNLSIKAAEFSYSPYSEYPVGAAVLTSKGKIFLGTNIENASYGLTICAERVAICSAISSGYKDIKAIAIYSKKGETTPCGACRQFILEFGKNIEVIYKKNSNLISQKISNLIPEGFSKEELK